VGCSQNTDKPDDTKAPDDAGKTIKVGLICIGDENDLGYTYNFIRGKDGATKALEKKGINVEWMVKWNIPEGDACEDANLELAEAGCQIIFNNSFGFEPYMLKVAPKYPNVQFVACTNKASATDELKNAINASRAPIAAMNKTVENFNSGVRDFSEFNYNLRGTVERRLRMISTAVNSRVKTTHNHLEGLQISEPKTAGTMYPGSVISSTGSKRAT
jgi:hypothetical protein